MLNSAENPDGHHPLAAAFAATDYVVEAPAGPRTVRIGAVDQPLQDAVGRRRWAILTAHNPGGRRASAAANRRAAARLEQRLNRIRPAVLMRACNHDPEGRWPDEPGWLFSFDAIASVDRLAREFRQAAVVTGGPEAPPALRFIDNPERASRP